jgi:hypothetical protein
MLASPYLESRRACAAGPSAVSGPTVLVHLSEDLLNLSYGHNKVIQLSHGQVRQSAYSIVVGPAHNSFGAKPLESPANQ